MEVVNGTSVTLALAGKFVYGDYAVGFFYGTSVTLALAVSFCLRQGGETKKQYKQLLK